MLARTVLRTRKVLRGNSQDLVSKEVDVNKQTKTVLKGGLLEAGWAGGALERPHAAPHLDKFDTNK